MENSFLKINFHNFHKRAEFDNFRVHFGNLFNLNLTV